MNTLAAEIAAINLIEESSDAVAVAKHLTTLATPLDLKLALFAVGQVDALVLFLVWGEIATHVLRRAHSLHHPVGVDPLFRPSLACGVAFCLRGRREQSNDGCCNGGEVHFSILFFFFFLLVCAMLCGVLA